jgi:hypothetical protein
VIGKPAKSRVLLLITAVVFVAIAVFFLGSPRPPPDPAYQGKPLSFWLKQELVFPGQPRFQLTAQATEAVRQIGTNALPLLLRRIEYRGGAFDHAIRGTVWRVGIKVIRQPVLDRLLLPSGYNPREAALGFQALGEAAKPAIPDLVRLVNSENKEWAMRALCYIGPASVEPLINAWPQIVDQDRRCNILSYLRFFVSEIGSNAPDFSPVVAEALRHNSNWSVRVEAIRTLEVTTKSPEIAMPVLVNLLGDHESIVQLTALDAIAGFGTNAQQAVPRLQELAKQDKDAQVRAKAAAVLKQIEPN